MNWFLKKFWVINGELFVVRVRERPKNGGTWWWGQVIEYWQATQRRLNFCFYLKEKSLQNGKGRISCLWPGKKKHKIGKNTLGRLTDLLNAFKSPGPFYILVSAANIQQSKSYSMCDCSLKNNLQLERQSIQQN